MEDQILETREADHDAVGILEYARIIWRWKWIVVITVVLLTALAFIVSAYLLTPEYESSTELIQRRFSFDKALLGTDVFTGDSSDAERDIKTSVELVKSPEVNAAVAARLGDRLGGEKPESFIHVDALNKVDLIQITATHPDPDTAADIANVYAEEFIKWKQDADQKVLAQARVPIEEKVRNTPESERNSASYNVLVDKLESLKLAEDMQLGNLQVISRALPALEQASPKPLRNSAAAFITSFFLGIGLVLLVNKHDKKIRNVEYVTSRIDKPILALIPRFPKSDGGLVTITHPISAGSEAYRLLKTNLQYTIPDIERKIIMFASPGRFEGKSTTVANLAVTLARGGNTSVTVLELDLRRPSLARHMGLNGEIGITNLIAGTHSFEDIIQVIPARDLVLGMGSATPEERQKKAEAEGLKDIFCITSGPIPPNPGELVASDKISSIIKHAGETSNYVLIDTPPLGIVSDAASLASRVDGIVAIVRMGQSEKGSFGNMQSAIKNTHANLLGFVITDSNIGESGYSSNY